MTNAKKSTGPTALMAILMGLIPGLVGSTSQAMDAAEGGPLPQTFSVLPSDNWWNVDIQEWPVDADSATFIAFINNGGTRRLHPDLGGDAPTAEDPTACYGMPFVVVSGVTAADLVLVQFNYASESDGVDPTSEASYPFYPIPPGAITQAHWVEGGAPGAIDLRDSEDRHLLIIDSDRSYLYELYNVFFERSTGTWHAGSGAFFDLKANGRRPDGWTSADAAGLAIFPGLIRYDEVYDPLQAEIGHAFRVTVRATDGYVYPASHKAGSRTGALPMGARLRLKASVDITTRSKDANMQRVFRAMQKHGLIVADNGSDLFVTGTYDPRWNSDILNPAFRALAADDFEVIELGYNPSAPPANRLKPVSNARGTVRGGEVRLNWEASDPGAKYQIEFSDSLAAAGWQRAGESLTNSWSAPVEAAVSSRFYRIFQEP